ncbi:MAG: twin-arginine translocase TatA/TatE family subunit [Chitinophagaceae bacterium]|nr:MAG: twin-arginine translocase TatA/TatE family subunit [Chitinophagaceae bacterium]
MYQGTLLEFLNMGGGEIMLIGIAILLLFGGKKLPELARGLGKGIREFKDASEGVKREIHRNINSVTNEEEEAKEELNHNHYHHPAEDQHLQSTADEYIHPEVGSQPHLDEEIPAKGKESHIE